MRLGRYILAELQLKQTQLRGARAHTSVAGAAAGGLRSRVRLREDVAEVAGAAVLALPWRAGADRTVGCCALAPP